MEVTTAASVLSTRIHPPPPVPVGDGFLCYDYVATAQAGTNTIPRSHCLFDDNRYPENIVSATDVPGFGFGFSAAVAID